MTCSTIRIDPHGPLTSTDKTMRAFADAFSVDSLMRSLSDCVECVMLNDTGAPGRAILTASRAGTVTLADMCDRSDDSARLGWHSRHRYIRKQRLGAIRRTCDMAKPCHCHSLIRPVVLEPALRSTPELSSISWRPCITIASEGSVLGVKWHGGSPTLWPSMMIGWAPG
jgi:hypothetical protein